MSPIIYTSLLVIEFSLMNYRRDIERFTNLQSITRFVPRDYISIMYHQPDESGKQMLIQKKIPPRDQENLMFYALSTTIIIHHAGKSTTISGIFNQSVAICTNNSYLAAMLWVE